MTWCMVVTQINGLKLANSLMLRIAVSVNLLTVSLAKEYIAQALDPVNGGVIETKWMRLNLATRQKFPLLNPFIAMIDYKECRDGGYCMVLLDWL